MEDDVGARDYDDVKEGLLIEGLRDWIYLSWIHARFEFNNQIPTRPVVEVQKLTLRMIRELVNDGLFILGVPDKKAASGFAPCDLPLDEAMAIIERKYVTNFEARWSWVTCAWLALTENGKALALRLYHADDRNRLLARHRRRRHRAIWPLGVATVPSSVPAITMPPTMALPTAWPASTNAPPIAGRPGPSSGAGADACGTSGKATPGMIVGG